MNQAKEIKLEEFESAVYGGVWLDAVNLLIQFLNKQQLFDVLENEGEERDEYETRVQLAIDRFASATTALLSSNQWIITGANFSILMELKNQLSKLYLVSSFNGTDHLFSILSSIEYENPQDKFFRFQLFISLQSNPKLFQIVMGHSHLDLATLIWVATELSLSDIEHEEIREQLIDMLQLHSQVSPISNYTLTHLATPWMFCSYLLSDKRHLVKASLNNMIRNRYAKDLDLLVDKKGSNSKPRLMVLLEVMPENHAMYRCYKVLMSQLQTEFHVTVVGKKKKIARILREQSNKFIEVSEKIDRNYQHLSLAKRLAKEKPDMIFAPSLGMDAWTIVIMNFRIAKLQTISLGHPATSAIHNVDFAITDCVNDPLCFTEKIVLPRNNKVPFVKPKFEITAEFKDDGYFHVAVVSSFMKINPIFLQVCRTISEQCERKIMFHIFPAADGVFYHYVVKEIQKTLPNSKIYKSIAYSAYLNLISRCSIRLGTFPFGGTNTNVDCFALGIPFVGLNGPEPFSYQDALFFDRAGFGRELIAENLDEYIQKAVKLISDDDWRDNMSEKMTRIYNSGVLFEGENNDDRGITVNTLKWIYENHEKMKNSELQVFTEGSPYKS